MAREGRPPLPLGPRHDTILHYITAYRATHDGFCPSIRQIATHLGVPPTGYAVSQAIKLLVASGLLMRMPDHVHNNLVLTPAGLARIGLGARTARTPAKAATTKSRATTRGSAAGLPGPAQLAHG